MREQILEVLPIAAKVRPVMNPDVEMMVVRISIGPNYAVLYECSYFDGRSYQDKTFAAVEVEATDANQKKQRIGFASRPSN